MTSTPSPASVLTCGHPDAGLRGPNGECMVPGCSGTQPCTARNTWRDSGDRGAAAHEHGRQYHPTHVHAWVRPADIVFGDYSWDTVNPVRCDHCGILPCDDRRGQCSPDVSM